MTGADHEVGFLLHWDGATWTQVEAGTFPALQQVSGVGRDQAYAVGAKGALIRWDGMRWSPMSTGTQSPLRSIWCAPGGTCWVGGLEGVVLRIENGTVLQESLPDKAVIDQLAGDESGTLWAVGSSAVYRRDNGTWSQSLRSSIGYYTIAVRSSTEVWAVNSGPTPSLWRWDGKQWTTELAPTSHVILTTFRDGNGRLWLAGAAGAILTLR